MTAVSLLVGMMANFFLYLMAIFFQSPDHLTEYDSTKIQDERHYLSQRIQVESAFHTAYWSYIGNKSNATFRLPNVNALVPFNGSRGVLAVAQDGRVWALNFDNGGDLHISKMFNIGLPPGLGKRGGIWHAAYDSFTSRLYFNVLNPKDGGDGIYFVDKVFSLLQKNECEEQVNMKLFIKGTSLKHEFQGISVEADRRILFAADQHFPNGSVGVWSLREEDTLLGTGGRNGPKELARLQSGQMLQPFYCTSYGDFLAVSEHSNDTIQIFKMVNKSESDPLCKQVIHVKTVAIKGHEFGKVDAPWGVSFDPAGNLLVADRGNKRIQIFHPSGNDSTTLTPVWQSDPVRPNQHLKEVTAIVTPTLPPSVRVVAIMFPGELVVYQ